MIDHTVLTFRITRDHQFGDDLRNRIRIRPDRTRARRATQRTHTALYPFQLLARLRLHELLFRHHQRTAANQHLALFREIQRYDWDFLNVDVLPHVELRPIRQREHADTLAWIHAAVEDVPQLGPLILGIPLAQLVAEGEDALFRSRFLFVAAG